MESSKDFDDVVVQSLIDTGVAEKIIHAVTATCVTYANLKGLLFAGFNKDYTITLFMDVKRSTEFQRIPYTQVKAEAFEYLESQQKKEQDMVEASKAEALIKSHSGLLPALPDPKIEKEK